MKLNILPPNPEEKAPEAAVGPGRFPSWLHRPLPQGGNLWETDEVLHDNRLPTVCEEAQCPNHLECWSRKTATFLAMGKECTRNCGFCSIDFSKQPKPPEADEPQRIADSVEKLGLKHVVITMVARDDLTDGGASHLLAIIHAIRERTPSSTIEILSSDFEGNREAWDVLLSSRTDICNYNIETVRSLTPRVRHKATYGRTLDFLSYLSVHREPPMLVKSGLMLGLGETSEEVHETLHDLKSAGVDIVTLGQYLQPNRQKLRVKDFIPPATFEDYAAYGHAIGIPYVFAGPFVRSSYNAETVFEKMKNR